MIDNDLDNEIDIEIVTVVVIRHSLSHGLLLNTVNVLFTLLCKH